MLNTILELRGVVLIVVLVEYEQLEERAAARIISDLQTRFQMPAMLVTRADASWRDAIAHAEFETADYLAELVALDGIEWEALREKPEAELPF